MATSSGRVLYRNGKIYTVDKSYEWWKCPKEAMLINNGRIECIGSKKEIEAYTVPGCKIVDLKQAVVLPGIHDVHMHPLEAGSPVGGTVELPADTDPENMIRVIKSKRKKQIGTKWVLGHGYSLHNMLKHIEKGGRFPKYILDEALGDTPGIMMEETSHSVWVNSKALSLANIDTSTPNIPGGIIMKDSRSGEPNGILLENAGNAILDIAMAPSPELEKLDYQGLIWSLRQLSKHGITSVCDARCYWKNNHHKAWMKAQEDGKLTVRAILGLWAYPHLNDELQISEMKRLFRDNPDELLRISQVKLYSDGLLDSTTAAVIEPYLIDYHFESLEENRGMNYFSQNRLTQYMQQLQAFEGGKGFDFHVHTIGDRAVKESLNAVEESKRVQDQLRPSRHRLTHVEMIDESDLCRFHELGVVADFQVAGKYTLPKYLADNDKLIGKSKSRELFPVRSVWETGAIVTLSSDWDVSELNPFVGIMHATQRGHQSVDLNTAVEMYTINAAYVMRQEDTLGSLEAGKEADFIVIDRDIFNRSPLDICKAKVLLTVVKGNEVFKS